MTVKLSEWPVMPKLMVNAFIHDIRQKRVVYILEVYDPKTIDEEVENIK